MNAHNFTGPHLIGIDVSHWDDQIDWAEVLAGLPGPNKEPISFAIIKATQGVGGTDPMFAHHSAVTHASGLPRGAYLFFMPGQSGTAQVEHFLSVARPQPGDIRPTLDIETEPTGPISAFVAEVEAAIMALKHATGLYPFVYTYVPFYEQYLKSSAIVRGCPTWLAGYGSCLMHNYKADIWQYTDAAPVPGVAKAGVDMNVFYGTKADLAKHRIPARPVTAVQVSG